MPIEIVKLKFSKGKKKGINRTKAALAYVEKDRPYIHKNKPEFFDEEDNADKKKFLKFCKENTYSQYDIASFRCFISVSEEEAKEKGIDIKEATRKIIEKYEKETNTSLTWIAAEHHDRGHIHTHVFIAARDTDGRKIEIRQQQLERLRNIAREETKRQEKYHNLHDVDYRSEFLQKFANEKSHEQNQNIEFERGR
jgi:hypothetical protein